MSIVVIFSSRNAGAGAILTKRGVEYANAAANIRTIHSRFHSVHREKQIRESLTKRLHSKILVPNIPISLREWVAEIIVIGSKFSTPWCFAGIGWKRSEGVLFCFVSLLSNQ